MNYPSAEAVLSASPLLPWIDRHFLRNDPFAFQGVDYQDFVEVVSRELDVDFNGVICMGSGAVGHSLNPGKITCGSLKPYGDDSDLDVALISSTHFEQAWRDLRLATQPTVETVPSDLRENLNWQKKRLFDGVVLTNAVLDHLSFGREWNIAFVRISEYVSSRFDREVEVNFWIFRDYWSVRNYVSESIVKCRRSIASV